MPDVREPLPAPSGQIDGDYGELVSALRQENARLRSAAAVRREDMDDYYTLWAHQIKTPIAAMLKIDHLTKTYGDRKSVV